MAINTAGMTPGINGDSFKARSPTSDGKSIDALDERGSASWGFNAEGISAFTGGEGSARSDIGGRHLHRGPVTNPYIEMRRKRMDLRMVRYQLANFGTLPGRQNQQGATEQASLGLSRSTQRVQRCPARQEHRLRTPDRHHILNISSRRNSLDETPSDKFQKGFNEETTSGMLTESLWLLPSPLVSSSPHLPSRLRTPELQNYISRRRLGTARVCVCVGDRERERETKRLTKIVSMCVCVSRRLFKSQKSC